VSVIVLRWLGDDNEVGTASHLFRDLPRWASDLAPLRLDASPSRTNRPFVKEDSERGGSLPVSPMQRGDLGHFGHQCLSTKGLS
jgi:hypothetical protein